jgi:acyl-ACP thioesterase
VDENKELTLTSLIDYFQDCSTFQSEALDIGIDFMQQHGRAWMILSWQVEVLRRPRLGEKIISQTWPYGFKAFYGYRNYALLDEAGHSLAKANSVWALIDVETGHPAKALGEYIAGYELEPKLEMAEFSRKIQMPQESRCLEPFPVVRNQLDSNHHVNNGQYIQMAEAFLPEDFETGFFRVEYRKQAHLHDLIVPMVHEDNGDYIVSLCDEQSSPYAIVAFHRKN